MFRETKRRTGTEINIKIHMEVLKLLLLLPLLWTPSGGQGSRTVSKVCVAMETCLLPCSFKVEGDVVRLEWIQTKEERMAFFYDNGKVHPEKQDPPFRGRTSMSLQQLSGGNGSLLLSSVMPRDQGKYLCQVTSGSTTMKYVTLTVEAPVKAVTLKWTGDVLVCRSESVYPRPKVSWTPPSEHQTQEEEMKNGLYSVNRSRPLDPEAPQCFTCNVSTDTSWKSATYCLQPPVERSANVTIPCANSTAPEKSLRWTFNGDQTIGTRSGGQLFINASFVESVLESGSLRLKDLGPEREGEFVCELHTDDSTFTSRTELRKPGVLTRGQDDSGVTPAVIGVVVGLVVLVVVAAVIIVFVMQRKKRPKKMRSSEQDQEQGQELLLEETNSPRRMLQRTLKGLSKDELEKFKSLLKDQSVMGEFPTNNLHTEEDVSKAMVRAYGVHSVSVTKRLLQKLQRNDLLEKLSNYDPEEIIEKCKNKMKSRLRERFKHFPETSGSSEKLEFNEGYTEGGSGHCQDIFNGLTQRLVLTKGGAGVGKTVLTQKFSLDWAESRTHQDVQLLLPFTFRELHVLRDRRFSLVGLVQHFFSEKVTKGLCSFQQLQLLFIFDGLDECRLPLDFSRTRNLTEPTESASVEELLVNLIRGNLLPSARLWITTRPTAANQIPDQCVSMVTEVRGFGAEQKEQYFRKRFRDEATDVISHIKTSPSLYGMCYNPLFCWILSVVLHQNPRQTEEPELPKTLTGMYIHFLLVQTKNILYEGRDETDSPWSPETTEKVQSLGKLAFEQLQKGSLIFSESDLSEYGLDAAEIARYSGVFREEPGLIEDKVYCFIHLTVQEFLAALHVHQTFLSSGENLLSPPHSSESPDRERAFYLSAVDRALQSLNGHLDLFLRFLLGLSLPTNQRLLTGLLTGRDQTNQETVEYIKEKLNEEGLSAERSLNLLHCLNELNNCDLVEQIQEFMRKERLSDRDMSPGQWSALSFLLLSSDLEEFDLREFCPSEKGLLGLLPVVKASTKATLSRCGLSKACCDPLASILSSSTLKHLDLGNNDLEDSGVERLCEEMKSVSSHLQTLSLSSCGLSQSVCAPLASVLSSSKHLKDLDLSNNVLRDSGVKLLCEELRGTTCELEILRLSGCLISEEGGASLAAALSSALSNVKELDLRYNNLGSSTDALISLRESFHSALQILRLNDAEE